MTKRSNLVLALSAAILIGLLLLLYLFVVRPRLAPFEVPEVATPPVAEEPALPLQKNAVLNLYFDSPLELRGISRIELTLLAAKMTMTDGLNFPIFEGAERIMSQKGVVQKVFSEKIFHGKPASLLLTLSPTAQVVYDDGRSEIVFLPNQELSARLTEEISLNQTLNVMLSLPPLTTFGEKNGVTTLKLPGNVAAEQHVMTSIFYNPRSHGKIYAIPNAHLADAIKADIGLDITPRPDRTGSSSFASPTEAPVQ